MTMNKDKRNSVRRQVPENFEVGDRVQVSLVAEAKLQAKEHSGSDEWLFTLALTNLSNTAAASAIIEGEAGATPAQRSVLWSTTPQGEVELVVMFGSRQRLVAPGLSAKQKASLRQGLEKLPAEEAKQLVSEILSEFGEAADQDEHKSTQSE